MTKLKREHCSRNDKSSKKKYDKKQKQIYDIHRWNSKHKDQRKLKK